MTAAGTGWCPVAWFAAAVDESMAVEHGMHGADRGRLHIAMQPSELVADLGSAPARSLALEGYDQLLDRERQLVGMPVRPATAINQSVQSAVLVPLEDLVAGLARDSELAAQDCHFLAVEQSRYESETSIHLVTLLPRHFALLQRPEVLLMSPE